MVLRTASACIICHRDG